jgi:hypothetical protein
MLQVFQMDVEKVDRDVVLVIRVCGKPLFSMFHFFLYMLQVCLSICCICFTHMLQVFYLNVAFVALAIHVCCKCMFQIFKTYVASVLSGCCICCSAHTHVLQTYIVYVPSVLDVYCSKCFILQVFHEQAQQQGVGGGGPLGRSGPHLRDRKCGAQSCIHGRRGGRSCINGRAIGMEHKAKWSTMLHPSAGCRRGSRGEAKHEAHYTTTLRLAMDNLMLKAATTTDDLSLKCYSDRLLQTV